MGSKVNFYLVETSMISEIYDAYNTRKKVYGFKSENMLSFKNDFKHTPGNLSGGDKG